MLSDPDADIHYAAELIFTDCGILTTGPFSPRGSEVKM